MPALPSNETKGRLQWTQTCSNRTKRVARWRRISNDLDAKPVLESICSFQRTSHLIESEKKIFIECATCASSNTVKTLKSINFVACKSTDQSISTPQVFARTLSVAAHIVFVNILGKLFDCLIYRICTSPRLTTRLPSLPLSRLYPITSRWSLYPNPSHIYKAPNIHAGTALFKLPPSNLPVSRHFTDHAGVASQDTSSGTLRLRPSFLERLRIRRSPSPNSKSVSSSRTNSVPSLTLSRPSSQGRSMLDAAQSGEGGQSMNDQLAAQPDAMSQLLLGVTTPPATTKRSRSQDSHRSEPSRLTTSGTNGNDQHTNPPAPQPEVKIPTYLNQQRPQIQKRFQDLEWHQRFRLQHAYANPETSPFRMDKSETVVNRNRYGNVQPWDSTRVKLRTPIGGSDYINASPISLKSQATTPSNRPDSTLSSTPEDSSSFVKVSEMKYIATQGPKDDQTVHFWHMVMQETMGPVGVIVMLTQCYEGIKEKCSQYFPKDMDNPVLVLDATEGEPERPQFSGELGDPFMSPRPKSADTDDLTTDINNDSETTDINETEGPGAAAEDDRPDNVALTVSQETTSAAKPRSGSVTLQSLNMDPKSRCEIRRMRLQIGDDAKEIYHYLFNGWPDYGKPEGEDRRALLELTRQTREIAQANEASADELPVDRSVNPRFVHCSAGVGRTGTFIALDWLLSQLEQGNLAPKATEQDSNLAAFQENSSVNESGKTETWGRSGPLREKESTPEARDGFDLIFDTVNKLREQRMMMVMNEIQYSFLYEVVKEAFVEKYARAPTVGVVDVGHVEEINSKGEAVKAGDVEEGAATPGSQEEDSLSDAETEIEGDPYQAAAPPACRAEVEGAKGVGPE